MNTASRKTSTPKRTIYETVTARIIESLKAGVIPWAKPWKGNSSLFPINFRSGQPYRGINVLLLWSSPSSSTYWLTFKQAQELGGTVRKGEKGTQIVFWKKFDKSTDAQPSPTAPSESREDDERSRFLCRYYTVFNVEQCDGLKLRERVGERQQIESDEFCEHIVNGWQQRPAMHLENEHQGRAYYRPSTDTVHMPTRNRFVDAPHYYSTLFHELIHSTGHENRLARTFGASFGDDLYSKEELIAETGAAFLCTLAGISNEHTGKNTTAYIQNWIKALEGDSRLIVSAAAAAQKAVDLIVGTRFEEEASGQHVEAEKPPGAMAAPGAIAESIAA